MSTVEKNLVRRRKPRFTSMKTGFSRNMFATKNVCLSGASRMRLSGALSDTPVRSYA